MSAPQTPQIAQGSASAPDATSHRILLGHRAAGRIPAVPWQTSDEAVLFLTSVFGLAADAPT